MMSFICELGFYLGNDRAPLTNFKHYWLDFNLEISLVAEWRPRKQERSRQERREILKKKPPKQNTEAINDKAQDWTVAVDLRNV